MPSFCDHCRVSLTRASKWCWTTTKLYWKIMLTFIILIVKKILEMNSNSSSLIQCQGAARAGWSLQAGSHEGSLGWQSRGPAPLPPARSFIGLLNWWFETANICVVLKYFWARLWTNNQSPWRRPLLYLNSGPKYSEEDFSSHRNYDLLWGWNKSAEFFKSIYV